MFNLENLKKIPQGNFSDMIVEIITKQIIDGNLKPGEKIPTEQEFCNGLGVSRNVVREAIKILVAMGVLEIRRPEGTFVVNDYSKKLLNPILYGLILTQRNMRELLELNIAMLREILVLAQIRITEKELEDLVNTYKEIKLVMYEEKNNINRMHELSTDFYMLLSSITKNDLFGQVYSMLLDIFSSARYTGFQNAVKYNVEDRHLNNYKLIIDFLSKNEGLTVDLVCKRIHEAWKKILL